MADVINAKEFNDLYKKMKTKYPKTLEWVKHKASWEHITLSAVMVRYTGYIKELMAQEGNNAV